MIPSLLSIKKMSLT